MSRINGVTNGVTFRGSVDSSVYNYFEDGLKNRVKDLRKEKKNFNAVPPFVLNQVVDEKNTIQKSIDKVNEFMKNHFHKLTKLVVEPLHTEKSSPNAKTLKLTNDLFPEVSVPLIKKTRCWYSEELHTGTFTIQTVLNNLNDKETIVSNETDLFKAWFEDTVKYFSTNSMGDKLYRFLAINKAKSKAKQIGIDKKATLEIIKEIVHNCIDNENALQAEKSFLKKLRLK